MIGESHVKGDLAELRVASELMAKGYKIAIPFGQNWRYDLIVERDEILERVQVKYTESKDGVILVKARSRNGKQDYIYQPEDFEWLIVYDKSTDCCYYLPSSMMGRREISLRLEPTKNGQTKGINWAKDYLSF